MGVWAWISRHRRALKLGSVAAAIVLFVGGLALGMSSAAGSPAPVAAPLDHQPSVPQKVSRHYVVGVVVGLFAPGRALVRARNGRLVVVEHDKQTIVRKSGQSQNVTAVRRGTRVIILGEP